MAATRNVHGKPAVCPFCGGVHELATGLSGNAAPVDDDVTLCIICGEWSIFSVRTKGGLRKPTDAEYQIIATTPLMRAARAAWVAIRKKKQQ